LFLNVLASEYPQIGKKCSSDSECLDIYEVCTSDLCTHKDSWPLTGLEWYGVFLVGFWLFGVCTAGTTGGGTLIIVLRAVFNFDLSAAIPLSNVSLVASGAVVYLFNFNKTHPLKTDTAGKPCGTMQDYNMILIMYPMGIIGSAIGTIIP